MTDFVVLVGKSANKMSIYLLLSIAYLYEKTYLCNLKYHLFPQVAEMVAKMLLI